MLLTNDNRLWEPPTSRRATRDSKYRLHHGRTLSGHLTWGTPETPHAANNRELRGTYTTDWRDYNHLDDRPGGTLRWLGWAVTGGPAT